MPALCLRAEKATREEEVVDLFKHVLQVNELADGYALRFPGSDTWANKLVLQLLVWYNGGKEKAREKLPHEPARSLIISISRRALDRPIPRGM